MRVWSALYLFVVAGTLLSACDTLAAAEFGRQTADVRPSQHFASANGGRTESFIVRVRGAASDEASGEIETKCEALRRDLQLRWLGDPGPAWRPPCEVVWHASRDDYVRAVGRGGTMTSGSSRVSFAENRIAARRIDVCGDLRDRAWSALAHELTHIVLADRFGARGAPRWADEGSAVLADSAEKQLRHHRDLIDAVEASRCLSFVELAAVAMPPSTDRVAVFYGQSASIVRFLTQQKPPADFMRFLDIAHRAGYDQAAHEVYCYPTVRDLEAAWRLSVTSQATDLARTDDASGG